MAEVGIDDTRLRWVHYNRGERGQRPLPPVGTERTRARERWESARRGRTVTAGSVARAVLEGRTKLSTVQRRLLAMLEEQAGADLLDNVASITASRGVLRIVTAEPAELYDLRIRWEQRILRLVEIHLPELGIHTVRFTLARRQDGPKPEKR